MIALGSLDGRCLNGNIIKREKTFAWEMKDNALVNRMFFLVIIVEWLLIRYQKNKYNNKLKNLPLLWKKYYDQ